MSEKRQKIQRSRLTCADGGKGEALRAPARVESRMALSETENPAADTDLMEAICGKVNLARAFKQVKRNRGAPGADGMTVDKLFGYLRDNWPDIREKLLAGTYEPSPVKRVEIPKPGGGMRKLGIPTALDRFIQQAVAQVLQKLYEPEFSEFSFGFRPRRSAHQAVKTAQSFQSEGRRWVVDMDLEKFFDRVNHDKLMGKLARKVHDKRLLRLIRAFLQAGVMENGLVGPTTEGTPQGGPLSPLLSNIVLDDLDKELERRGHKFVRYADDCNIYVNSYRAGQRVMNSISRFVENKLKLKVNKEKSAVDRPWNRKFLGFSFTRHKMPKRRISPEARKRFKCRVRQLTKRNRHKDLPAIILKLSQYLRGWKGYYGFCETDSVLNQLDKWVRRRLRCLIRKRWKTGKHRYTELRKLGVSDETARMGAASTHGPWRMSRNQAMSQAFPNAYFDSLGLVRLSKSAA